MLRAILNKSWWQHPTRHQLYGHLPPITKTIQVRRTRHAGHCWRSRNELISDVLLWTPKHGRAKAGRPARTYIQQLCEDTGCCPEDLPEAMNDREKWRERVRDIRATSTTWWWWWVLATYYLFYLCSGHFHQLLDWERNRRLFQTVQQNQTNIHEKNVSKSTVRSRLCEAGLYLGNWYQATTVEGAKQFQKTLVGQGSQLNRGIKSLRRKNQSSKSFGRIGGSICVEELLKELQPLYHINCIAWRWLCYC